MINFKHLVKTYIRKEFQLNPFLKCLILRRGRVARFANITPIKLKLDTSISQTKEKRKCVWNEGSGEYLR